MFVLHLAKSCWPVMLSILHPGLFLPFSNPLPTAAGHPEHALLLLLLQLSVSAAAAGGPANLIQRNDFWLPDDVVPVNYNLSLLVNMEELTTEGKVKIRLEVKNATDQIILHVQPNVLTVMQDNVEVYDNFSHHNAKKIPIKEQGLDKMRMFFTVKLSKRVTEGTKLDLIIPFTGNILNGTAGFYLSPDGVGGRMALTQFEPMRARMAFPCFDEPRFKAGC